MLYYNSGPYRVNFIGWLLSSVSTVLVGFIQMNSEWNHYYNYNFQWLICLFFAVGFTVIKTHSDDKELC